MCKVVKRRLLAASLMSQLQAVFKHELIYRGGQNARFAVAIGTSTTSSGAGSATVQIY